MGNNKSVTPNDKKNGAAPETNRANKEHETVKEIVEICEFFEDEESDVLEEKETCVKGSHKNYKLMKAFKLDSLPVDIQDKFVFDYICHSEKLVVRLKLTTDRPPKEKATAEHQERERINICGTGFAMADSAEIESYEICPLENCAHNNIKSHKSYGGLIIYTNHHVVQNDAEVSSCQVDFFYNENVQKINILPPENLKATTNIDSKGVDISRGGNYLNKSSLGTGSDVLQNCEEQACDTQNEACPMPDGDKDTPKQETAYGYRLREIKENKDLVGLKIIFHNPNLFYYVADRCSDRLKAWFSISEPVKRALKKHAVVISHPHGFPKRISFGRLLSLEQDNIENENGADDADGGKRRKKVTIYDAQTCSGSSGAPVLVGHYLTRPFIHSSKRIIGEEKVNISYSY